MTHKITPIILLGILAFGFAKGGWLTPDRPGFSEDLRFLTLPRTDPDNLFAASSREVFFRRPESGLWSVLWRLPADSTPLRELRTFEHLPDMLFAAGGRSIVRGSRKSAAPEAVFVCPSRQTALSFAARPSSTVWLAACSESLFRSENSGVSWERILSFHDPADYSRLLLTPSGSFLIRPFSLLRSEKGLLFSEIFSLPSPDQTDEEDPSPPARIRDLVAEEDGALFLATDHGILFSSDTGLSWRPVSTAGLPSGGIRRLAVSHPNSLFALTTSGVFFYSASSSRWESLYTGLAGSRLYDIAVSPFSPLQLWVLSSDGIQQWLDPQEPSEKTPPPAKLALLYRLFSLEPSMRSVHLAVIRAANLDSQKISRWHAASRAAALLPDINLGGDLSQSPNIDLDRGSTSDPDRYIFGPEETSRQASLDISWDLGDMLFSTAQTSIDGREKLMVELRHELLSEATRLYHERRRLQIETVFESAPDTKTHLESLLRMDELTALLDAMTGGYFLEHIKEIYREVPGLETLWEPGGPVRSAKFAVRAFSEALSAHAVRAGDHLPPTSTGRQS